MHRPSTRTVQSVVAAAARYDTEVNAYHRAMASSQPSHPPPSITPLSVPIFPASQFSSLLKADLLNTFADPATRLHFRHTSAPATIAALLSRKPQGQFAIPLGHVGAEKGLVRMLCDYVEYSGLLLGANNNSAEWVDSNFPVLQTLSLILSDSDLYTHYGYYPDPSPPPSPLSLMRRTAHDRPPLLPPRHRVVTVSETEPSTVVNGGEAAEAADDDEAPRPRDWTDPSISICQGGGQWSQWNGGGR